MTVKRSWSPSLAIKNTRQLQRSTISIELRLLLHGLYHGFALESAHLQPLSWFLASVSRLRPLLLDLYSLFPSLISHTSPAVPHFSPAAWRQQRKVCPSEAQLIFSCCLAAVRHLRPPAALTQKAELLRCWHNTLAYLHTTHRKPR